MFGIFFNSYQKYVSTVSISGLIGNTFSDLLCPAGYLDLKGR